MADKRARDTTSVKVPDDDRAVRTASGEQGSSAVELDGHCWAVFQRVFDNLWEVLLKWVCMGGVG